MMIDLRISELWEGGQGTAGFWEIDDDGREWILLGDQCFDAITERVLTHETLHLVLTRLEGRRTNGMYHTIWERVEAHS